MFMNNPMCGKMPVITNSNKLRTYTSARYHTDDEVLKAITGGERKSLKVSEIKESPEQTTAHSANRAVSVPEHVQTKEFKGRVVVPGVVKAEALVSRQGFNTLASFQKSLMAGDKEAKCSDQNNPDIYGKSMTAKALCLPQTIGSTTGGMVLYCAADLSVAPACLLFSKTIDSLAAAGSILAGVWTENPMPTIDSLGDEFLETIKTGMSVSVSEDGVVTIQ
jgi:predicted aconitase with swiveling domain